jgi:hypothetical protein
MVMKKASDGDSPLWQGAGKSFWTLPISHQRRWRLAVCFMEIDRGSLGFPIEGNIQVEGQRQEVDQGGSPPGGAARAWPPSVSAWDSGSCSGKIGGSAFVSSNSENISCVAFLKHKNSRK